MSTEGLQCPLEQGGRLSAHSDEMQVHFWPGDHLQTAKGAGIAVVSGVPWRGRCGGLIGEEKGLVKLEG